MKPEKATLELGAFYDGKTENFIRIIVKERARGIRGRVYIPRGFRIPSTITITVKRKEVG